MITCPNCGRENAETVRLCSFCDHELRPTESINCPSCGRLNAPENEVCPHCGHRLSGAAPRLDATWAGLGAPDLSADDTAQSATLATQPDRFVPQAERPAPGVGEPGDMRDFFSDLDDESAAPPREGDDRPDWFDDSLELPEGTTRAAESKREPADDALPDWLGEGPATPADAAPSAALPDWLDEGTTLPIDARPAEGLPDWLADDTAPPPRTTPPTGGPSPSDELREWFTDEPAAGGEDDEEAPAAELPDWFAADLAADDEAKDVAPAAPVEPSDELRDLFADDLMEDEEEAVATPADDLPDWLSGEAPDVESEALAEAEDLPDWLSGDDFGGEEEAAPLAEADAADGAPDWLDALPDMAPGGIPEASETAEPSTGSLLDRLAGAGAAPPEQAAGIEPTQAEAEMPAPGEAEPAMPDWLEATVSTPVAGADASDVVSDDWLDQVLGAEPAEERGAEPAAEEAVGVPTFEAGQGSDTLDWLDDALGAEPEEAAAGPEPESAGMMSDDRAALFDDDMPDWLRAARAKQTGGLPAILAGLETGEEAEGEPAEAEPPTASADWLPDVPVDDDMPDWLQAARAKQTGQPPPEPRAAEPPSEAEAEPAPAFEPEPEPVPSSPPAFVTPLPDAEGLDDDMPDWLRAMQPGGLEAIQDLPLATPPTDDSSPFEGSLFDWLDEEPKTAEETPATAEEEGRAFAITEPVDLESADLPEWLEALRPDEAPAVTPVRTVPVAPVPSGSIPAQMEMLRAANIPGVLDPEAETREETVGPLKGVMGVVAASSVFTTLQRAAAPRASAALAMDSAQISLLEAVLRPQEGITRRVTRPVAATVAHVLVTLLMIAAVALPIAGGFVPFNAPGAIDVPAADAARSMVGVGPSPNVLLAFEYDPSQAGELSVEAETLITYLMARDATLYAVSTQPTGPALAQTLLDDLAAENGYVYGEDYLNLGYVSGDAAGVRGLVTGVTEGTVSPLAFDYQGTPTETGQNRLADLEIDLIVLLAGTPDAVRIWVEQAANPSAIPMVAAVGAGVEPMALPYYHQGRQLEGVVSGLAGATGFARATQGPTLPEALNARWNAQVAGALAAGLVILIGLIAGMVPTGAARREQETP